MKAFVYRVDERTNQPKLPGFIVGPYISQRNLERYGLRHCEAGLYRIEMPYSWERRYSPDLSRDFKIWEYRKF